ncbi:MAG: hypothetical protein WBD40_22070 [Tepidisphaeraceae bacterium]
MAWQLHGTFGGNGRISWLLNTTHDYVKEHSLRVSFHLRGKVKEKAALRTLADKLNAANVAWLKPAGNPAGKWILDFDALKVRETPTFDRIDSWRGRVFVKPQCEFEQDLQRLLRRERFYEGSTHVWWDYPSTENDDDGWDVMAPLELQPHLEKFRLDHPQPMKVAFVMMRFEDTDLHKQAFAAVRNACAKFGITALRADGKAYADDLLPNIKTYMHGCGFGVAIFERIVEEYFNPNVSLEVGYMLGMGKRVCLLKDKTLTKGLQTDLVGSLYEPFDAQHAAESIPPVLEKWMRDREFVV